MNPKIDLTDFLINNYGFSKIRPILPREGKPIDYNGYYCQYPIHEVHWLIYSPLHMTFSIRRVLPRPEGIPSAGGGVKEYDDVMLPRTIYSKDDAIEILVAFKID